MGRCNISVRNKYEEDLYIDKESIIETKAFSIERHHVVESIVNDLMHEHGLDGNNYYDDIVTIKNRLINESDSECVEQYLKDLNESCFLYALMEGK